MVVDTGVWTVGTVVGTHTETPTARSITLDVPGWPGNIAGQHVDVRLTAEDGYTAVRSYSLASWGETATVQLAVDAVPDGEVSPYLVEELRTGDQLELRGPLGGWFVWKPTERAPDALSTPVQLICGGSGIVPLMAMIRAHAETKDHTPFRLLYSVRTPDDIFFADELAELAESPVLDVTYVFTRRAPAGWTAPIGRVTAAILEAETFPPTSSPAVYVCGPTGFVESVADTLVALGHDPIAVKTERFGGA